MRPLVRSHFSSCGIVAVLQVAPVDDIDRAVGAGLQIDGHVARIGREEQVVAGVQRLVAGAAAAR